MRNIFIIIIILFTSCSSKKEEDTPQPTRAGNIISLTEAQIKSAGIETGFVELRTLSTEINVNGIVDVPPQNTVSISFPLGGFLKSTNLLPGMHVTKGQVIARIEDPALVQLQQDYLMAVAKLHYLEKENERQKILNENEVNAEKIYQQVVADYQSQKILVKGLSEKLRLVNINTARLDENSISGTVPVYSPINGFVSKVNVNIGKYVNPSDVLFELINPDDMHAALTIFEKDLPMIRPKQKVKVSFVEDPQKTYDCEVLLVSKNVDNNRSALVHCHFETQPKQLLPGMFLNASIMVDNVESFTVPEEAVVRYGDTEYIIESETGNTYKLVAVIPGIRQNKFIAIRSNETDLKGKKIVIKNAYSILSQMMNVEEK